MKKSFIPFILIPLSILSVEKIYARAIDSINAPLVNYISPFNASEFHFTDTSHFYKWRGVLARIDADRRPLQPLVDNRAMLKRLPPLEMAQKVDDLVNQYRYIDDQTNWNVADYWETPAEFFAHGGDCEDFAIAKYVWLRSLGVSEERLRLAIVYDRIQTIPHVVLVLYLDNTALVLDSQVAEIRDSTSSDRYRLLYSINRLGWWYPVTPGDTRIGKIDDMDKQTGITSNGTM